MKEVQRGERPEQSRLQEEHQREIEERVREDCHEASRASGTTIAVSSSIKRPRPSAPTKYSTSNVGIQLRRASNWSPPEAIEPSPEEQNQPQGSRLVPSQAHAQRAFVSSHDQHKQPATSGMQVSTLISGNPFMGGTPSSTKHQNHEGYPNRPQIKLHLTSLQMRENRPPRRNRWQP